MRLLRSMAFAAAALACSLITSMPASAAIPIEPGFIVTANVKEHPAPVAIVVVDDVAIQTSEQPSILSRAAGRSYGAEERMTVAASSFMHPAYKRIDPDISR